jgi:DNA-binding XRE family transcriptional regulator
MERQTNPTVAGRESYCRWREGRLADPEGRRLYEDVAKGERWLQPTEARQAARLTHSEVARRLRVSQTHLARIEKHGYETYTLNMLRRYVTALGEAFCLHVTVQRTPQTSHAAPATAEPR